MGAEEVWPLLARPVDGVRVAAALLGIPVGQARAAAAVGQATGPEAEDLLARMPQILRSLGASTTVRPERCHAEIRGPVLWSETVSARAATAGATNVYVCTIAGRAYDTAENRVLVAALQTIVRSAELVARVGGGRGRDRGERRARHNAGVAVRHLGHRALNGLAPRPPSPRELQRVRTGKRRRSHAPALAVLSRSRATMGATEVDALADPRTQAQHRLLVQTVVEMRRRGHRVAPLAVDGGALRGGAVRYEQGLVAVGELLLRAAVGADGRPTDPATELGALAEVADGRSCAVVAGPGDLEWALDQARF